MVQPLKGQLFLPASQSHDVWVSDPTLFFSSPTRWKVTSNVAQVMAGTRNRIMLGIFGASKKVDVSFL